MLAKRIIPCLDVKDGRVVKGINFIQLEDAGDPVSMARFYYEQGADELVFLDITASSDKRKTLLEVIKKVAKEIYIPFTVGGGISSVEDMREVLFSGADKVAINTAAVKNPQLISDGAKIFGSQCIVVAIDVKRNKSRKEVYINGGRINTGIDVIKWAKEVVRRGAGEILLTSMDRDGTKEGYDVELTKELSGSVHVPIIASGGAGSNKDFRRIFTNGNADAALAASLFHYGELSIGGVKEYLNINNILVRR